MKNSFIDLGISPPILKALEAMGFEAPTEVQSKAIPHILNHEDLIVRSKTGSGKTAVFGVPMLQMIDPEANSPQGLILTPTRELAVQVDSDLKMMAKYLKHRTTAVYGQHNMNIEIEDLQKRPVIVTGTPGRVFDHIRQGNLVTKHIHFLVLDEADRMLDMGFLDQVVRIIKTIPRDRMTMLFSATIPPEIQNICRDFMKRPGTIEIESSTKTVETTQQVYYRVEHNEKNTQLNRLLLLERPESCIIFCNTKIKVDRVQNFLIRKGYAVKALHGDIPQSRRLRTIQQFKQGVFPLLVATDVAARGIHVDELSLVVNYDVPLEKDGYVHRIGRTGRAGAGGRAITLVTSDDIMSLYEIEEHIGVMIEEKDLPGDKVLNQQRDEIEKWKQKQVPTHTQVQKSMPPRSVVETVPKDGAKKRAHSRNSQQRNKSRDRSAEGHREDRTAQNVRPVHTSQQHDTITDSMPKSTPAQSLEPRSATVQTAAVVVEKPADEKKAPFLKRVLQRILGRQ